MDSKQVNHKRKLWFTLTIVWAVSCVLAFWIGRQTVINADYPLAAATYVTLVAHEEADYAFLDSKLAEDAVLTASKRLSKSEKANINTILRGKDWYQQLVWGYALGYWTGTHWEGPPVSKDLVDATTDYIESMALISIRYKDEDWESGLLSFLEAFKDPGLTAYVEKQPFPKEKETKRAGAPR